MCFPRFALIISGCAPEKQGCSLNKYAIAIRKIRELYKNAGEPLDIPLSEMVVYGSDLGSTYDEIFRKSLLFHEGKLNEKCLLSEIQLSDEYYMRLRYEVYPEDIWTYEFFLKQIEVARDICLRSEEQMRNELLGTYPAELPKNAVVCRKCCASGMKFVFIEIPFLTFFFIIISVNEFVVCTNERFGGS